MEESIELTSKVELLSKQPVFSPLQDDEKEILASILLEKHFSPGDIIVKEGDPVDSVYLIMSGQAEVIQSMDNIPDKVHVVAVLGPNDAIGLNETGFYSLSGIRTATVKAKTELVTLRMSVAAFHGFALAYPHVNEVMRKNAAHFLMSG